MTRALLAVDPGAISGAAAFALEDRDLVMDLPVVAGQLDAAMFARMVRVNAVGTAVVELVGAMPKQGVSSTFRFGYAAGAIYGVLMSLEVPTYYVLPSVWKRHHGLIGKDKEASRALAIRLHPEVRGLELKKHQGRAEALLMLDWYRDKENRRD